MKRLRQQRDTMEGGVVRQQETGQELQSKPQLGSKLELQSKRQHGADAHRGPRGSFYKIGVTGQSRSVMGNVYETSHSGHRLSVHSKYHRLGPVTGSVHAKYHHGRQSKLKIFCCSTIRKKKTCSVRSKFQSLPTLCNQKVKCWPEIILSNRRPELSCTTPIVSLALHTTS